MVFEFDYTASSGIYTHSGTVTIQAETRHDATLKAIETAKKQFKKAWPTIKEITIKIDFK